MPITAATAAAAAPYVAAAIQAVGSNIASGQMNRRAARVARETNALNYQMFQEGNEFNERMYNEANAWNSPVNQRKLLEEAGYNPGALFDANIGSANPVSSVSANPAQGYTPTAPDYSNIGLNAIQSYLALKQAKKVDAETLGQQIENGYKAENIAADLALKGAQTGNLEMVTKGQELKNIVDEASLEPDILLREETANKALADAEMASLKTKQENLKAALYDIYGPKEAEQQYQNLVKQGGVLDAQQESFTEQAGMFKAEGAAATKNAETNRMVGVSTVKTNQSVAASNYAQANKANNEAYAQAFENEFRDTYKGAIYWQRFHDMVSEGKMKEAKAYLLKFDADWIKGHPKASDWRKQVDAWFGPFVGPTQSGIGAIGAVEGAKILAK